MQVSLRDCSMQLVARHLCNREVDSAASICSVCRPSANSSSGFQGKRKEVRLGRVLARISIHKRVVKIERSDRVGPPVEELPRKRFAVHPRHADGNTGGAYELPRAPQVGIFVGWGLLRR